MLSFQEELAYHEAGHAVAAFFFGYNVFGITIKSTESAYAHAHYAVPQEIMDAQYTNPASIKHLRRRLIIISMAGRCTELAFSEQGLSLGDKSDRDFEWEQANHLCDDGYDEEKYIDPIAQTKGMIALLIRLEGRTRWLVSTVRFRNSVEALVRVALIKKTIASDETNEIIKAAFQASKLRRI